jgi:hypothetical protein
MAAPDRVCAGADGVHRRNPPDRRPCSVRAYQIEDASRIAPFEYSYLMLMPIYDVVLWGNWPQPLTLVGMALICGAGVFVAWREGRPPRPQVHPRGEDPWTPDAETADKGA